MVKALIEYEEDMDLGMVVDSVILASTQRLQQKGGEFSAHLGLFSEAVGNRRGRRCSLYIQ